MTKTVEEKAAEILTGRRLRIERVDEWIMATCLSSDGLTTYRLGFDPRNREWRCTCAALRPCSHLAALRLVVVEPKTGV